MTPLALAVSLFLAPAAEAAASAVAPTPAEASAALTGAPKDDYQFVAWCFGALSGYLDLHDRVMPEVTRIESAWRRPGTSLADDLQVYADQQRQGRADLKSFRSAMTAAEKASLDPLNVQGAAAIARGRAVWNPAPDVNKARLAQEWMSWTLPARCQTTAAALEERARLLGASFKVNAEPEPVAQAAPPETAEN